MARVTVTLTNEESNALIAMAIKEMRYPRDHAHFLLRNALLKSGYLSEETKVVPSIKCSNHKENENE